MIRGRIFRISNIKTPNDEFRMTLAAGSDRRSSFDIPCSILMNRPRLISNDIGTVRSFDARHPINPIKKLLNFRSSKNLRIVYRGAVPPPVGSVGVGAGCTG